MRNIFLEHRNVMIQGKMKNLTKRDGIFFPYVMIKFSTFQLIPLRSHGLVEVLREPSKRLCTVGCRLPPSFIR